MPDHKNRFHQSRGEELSEILGLTTPANRGYVDV
jgi:hypothetical protein